MAKYRKKSVVIEAFQLTLETASDVAKWCGGHLHSLDDETHISIYTLEGEMQANLYDWVIKGIKGEFYPCKPDIFQATYELSETLSNDLSTKISTKRREVK